MNILSWCLKRFGNTTFPQCRMEIRQFCNKKWILGADWGGRGGFILPWSCCPQFPYLNARFFGYFQVVSQRTSKCKSKHWMFKNFLRENLWSPVSLCVHSKTPGNIPKRGWVTILIKYVRGTLLGESWELLL